MVSPEVFVFSSTDDISAALDSFLTTASANAIAKNGRFTVSLSGGSLPKVLGAKIRTNEAIDWSKWHIFFADERCVAHDHDDSNYKLAKDELLDHVPIPSSQVYAINEKLVGDRHAAAKDYVDQLEKVFGKGSFPSIDVNLLGIGPDGHCCSLFPGHALLDVKDVWVASLDDSPKPPPSRITLTYPVVNNAAVNLFVSTGESKADALHKILDLKEALPSGRGEGDHLLVDDRGDDQVGTLIDSLSLPVTAQNRLIWFLDTPATNKLSLKPLKYSL
ncbi:6-phosphogluconolactonase [Thoreauomyces humboldtii]|nr:6-phosphogluconolactonase [Thoreauomyces humboldtii]